MELPNTIFIDGVQRRVVRTVLDCAGSRNGWLAIQVSADNSSSVPVAQHSLPRGWLYNDRKGDIVTGGHTYSHRAPVTP